ncbi:hypothetical protein J2Z49_002314 [Desulfofundulus luciae]|uniref:Restriction endonuclease type IV Mrr domain-containing protein n=1 Tax=Desulfofundulus luciae TaxID=74702 RepID=A0ABU0B399_9FIRM|nr:restriction endonuclease [Desulfofundulus luciae]MDQ0287195.1 hypothetical protein [Desulfofundulus luciae]
MVPKVPTWGHFVIARVTDGYSFDFNLKPDDADFRHKLMVDPNSLRVFPHYANEETLIVAGKLRGYQKAVNNVWDEKMKEAIERLLETEDKTIGSKDIDRIFRESMEELLRKVLHSVQNYPPGTFENLVKGIFEASGYELARSHFFDGSGGDADFVFSLKPPILSEVASKSLTVYVQVKNKKGVDNGDVNGIDQLSKIAKEPDALKILISSADNFTEECIRKAEENGVTLIGGLDVARLLLFKI